MAERIVLTKEGYVAKDAVTGEEVQFGEMAPRGETTGKVYGKHYVSIPNKGGWFVSDENTGEILSTNPTVGYSSDSLSDEEKKKSVVAPTNCPVCQAWYMNPFALSAHTEQAHGQTYEALKEAQREAEEAAVQKEMARLANAAPVASPPVEAPVAEPPVVAGPPVVAAPSVVAWAPRPRGLPKKVPVAA